jgi:hypothetical protein
MIAKQAQATTISSFRSDSDIATITNIQLPGIIPNNNNNNNPSSAPTRTSPSSPSSDSVTTSNPSSNSPAASTPPATIVHRNTDLVML